MKVRIVVFFWGLIIFSSCSDVQGQDFIEKKIDSLYNKGNQLRAKDGDSLINIANLLFELSDRHNNKAGQTKSMVLASLYYINKMKLDTATYLLTKCESDLKNNEEELNTNEGGSIYYMLAQIALRRSQFSKAEELNSKALEIFSAIKNQNGVANAISMNGDINYLEENYDEALTLYLQALKIKLGIHKNPNKYRSELLRISDIYDYMGQYKEALKYLRGIAKSDVSDRNKSDTYRKIGTILVKLGSNDSAMYYFLTAKELIAKSGDNFMLAIIDFNVAELLSQMGKYEQSNKMLLPAFERALSTHSRMTASLGTLIAFNYFSLKNYEKALHFERIVYSYSKTKDLKYDILKISDLLAKTFLEKHKHDSAYYYRVIYGQYKDLLYGEESQNKLSALYAKVETLTEEREIELLEKQRQIEDAQSRNIILSIALGSIALVSFLICAILFYRYKQKRQILSSIRLQNELDNRNRDLYNQTSKMININNSLMQVEDNLKQLHFQSTDSAKNIRSLLNSLQFNKTLEKEWDNFNQYFGAVHISFYEKINADFPHLTTSEKRLASLIKIKLTNREIASILNIESSSVKIAKYRLKRKLNLSEEENINTFFQNF